MILYNENWGKTDWTNKEEIVIRNRIVSENWKFILFVKVKNSLEIPEWYLNEKIWIDYEDDGPKGVASIIEFKVRELNGIIKNETIVEKAKRINDEKQNLQKIRNLLAKEYEGIKLAENELIILFEITKSQIDKIKQDAPNLFFKIIREESNYLQIETQLDILNIHWWPRSSNFLDGSHLDINMKEKHIHTFETTYRDVVTTSYNFNINPSWINGWQNEEEFYSSPELVDFWLNYLLERLEGKKKLEYNIRFI